MQNEEQKLIKSCINGQYIAQKKLYDLYASKFFAVTLRYSKNHDEAEDILQDAFIKIFDNLQQFQFKGSFEGWMRRIVVNTAIEYYRKSLIGFKEAVEFESIVVQDFDIQTYDYDQLINLIQDLPVGYRTIFNLYAIEGYTHIQIAEILNISEGTSKSQFSRARSILKEKVNKLFKNKSDDTTFLD
jgi:RNA polymerase sigma factor (sigma-70 family)